MIEGLKPYTEYKKSGSKWLGDVPVAWEIHNLRTLISKRTEKNRVDLPLLSVAREKGVFVRSLTDTQENHNVIPEDLSNYKVARAGDLVINKMKAWQGSMGIAPCDGIVSPAYYVFGFRIANPTFGQRLLRSKPYVSHFGQASDGVRVGQWDLSITGMRQIPVLVPSILEQAAIVKFLDHANRKIDSFISGKRKLILLLNEQKQAIIHHAVTRGIDTDIELKPSGVNYLGDIPKHWNVAPARAVFTEVIERGHPKEQMLSVTIRRGIITQSQLLENSIKKDSSRQDRAAYKLVCVGDIAYNKMRAWQGAFGVSDLQGIVSPAYVVVRSKSLADSRFYHYLFRTPTFATEAERWSYGIASDMWSLRPEHFRLIKLPIPPEAEQNAIGMHLDKELVNYNAAIARTEREIILMQEYRTRLIADIVTGKLDVRDAATTLPEEIVSEVTDEPIDLSDEVDFTDEEIDA